MENSCTIGVETTRERRRREVNSPVYAPHRNKPLIETHDDLLFVMGKGGSAVNATLRVLHNLALGFVWLPAPIITAKLWPKVKARPKRGITAAEHAKILAAEQNEERRDFHPMLWIRNNTLTRRGLLQLRAASDQAVVPWRQAQR